jgi:hypothetical protein
VVNATPRPLYPRQTDPVPIVQEVGWALGSVWTGAEYLAPTGIRSPDRPPRSESLYRLSYPGPRLRIISIIIIIIIIMPSTDRTKSIFRPPSTDMVSLQSASVFLWFATTGKLRSTPQSMLLKWFHSCLFSNMFFFGILKMLLLPCTLRYGQTRVQGTPRCCKICCVLCLCDISHLEVVAPTLRMRSTAVTVVQQ